MNKKILLGLSVLGMSAAFWACGDGSIEALNSDDDVALVNYGEFNPEAMRTLVSGATEACTADPECAAKMESAVDVPPPEQAPADSGATPGSSGAADTPANSSPSTTPTSSPAGTSSSGTSPNTNPTVSSSSTSPNTNPTVSSSSTQQQQTQSSSSQQQTQPSSDSQQTSASSVDPTGATPIELVYGQTTTKLTGGKWSVTSNNQYSGILFCKADESVTVTADGNTITVTSSETNYGNIKPRSGSPVIIEVPDGKTIECRTDW